MDKSIDIEKIYELIDLYKYASVEGERVEIIVTPYEENGKWDDSKRVISIGLQNGISRDRDTFVVDNAFDFDNYVLPQLLAYYSIDDTLGSWDITSPNIEGTTNKGVSETERGNVVYLESFDSNIYQNVLKEKENVESKTTYNKTPLTDEEKIWDEVLLYTKRKITNSFYNSKEYSDEEKQTIYDFILKVIDEEKQISIGNAKKYRDKNEKLFEDLFNDREKLISYGLNEDLISKIIDLNEVKALANIAGNEKRVRRRLDLDNSEIQSKIKFAMEELVNADYFNLKNASAVQFENNKFVSSQPKTIKKLEKTYDDNITDKTEEREMYKAFCSQIFDYLEKKANNNKKIIETEVEVPKVEFKELDNAIVNSYDKLYETLNLVRYGKLDDENYEVIVENGKDNTSRRVRISLTNGAVRGDSFEFLFTNGEEFDKEFKKMQEEIRKEDPDFITKVITVNTQEKDQKISFQESQDGNEFLIKNASDTLLYPTSAKQVEAVDDDTLAKLLNLESQILEEAKSKYEENLNTLVNFETLHNYVNNYKISNQKGYLQILSRKTNEEYVPKSDAEKRNIEFAFYWLAMTGIEEEKDDIVAGEKYAFGEDNKELFKILNNHIREALESKKEIDFEQLREKFKQSGINHEEEIYNRLFRNQFYNEYITKYYSRSLNSHEFEDEDINYITEVRKKSNNYDDYLYQSYDERVKFLEDVLEQAKKLQAQNEYADILTSAKDEAYKINSRNEEIEIINGAEEQAKILAGKEDSLFEIVERTDDEPKLSPELVEMCDAFDVVESYATEEQPTSVKIFFEKQNPGFAEVIISNGIGENETVMYQRTFDEDKIKQTIIPLLCKLYVKDNDITYNKSFDVPNTTKAGLVVVGTCDKTFQVSNAEKEIINLCQETLEKELEKSEEKETVVSR